MTDKHDSVIIVTHDPTWAEAFEHVKADLLVALAGHALAAEHIGSTAVPGLSAKPVIDVLVGVKSLDDVAACVPIMVARGWEFPEDFNRGLVGRRFFLKRDAADVRTHHAHFVAHEGPLWNEYVIFRDRLRESPVLRERYAASKTDFVKEVLGLGDDVAPQSHG